MERTQGMKIYLRWKEMSATRQRYFFRLAGRCLALLIVVYCAIWDRGQFQAIGKGCFLSSLQPVHLLWVIWMIDMLEQIVPVSQKLSIGSLKLFPQNFRPILGKINRKALKEYIITTTKAAYRVMILWIALIAAIGFCYYRGWIDAIGLFVITSLFYVCDLICVLIWCPFRLLMKNRCCTTCRIFNWDHLMMFSPMLFMPGFFGKSLLVASVLVFLIWEAAIILYPERFWEKTNVALQCAYCTDKLCTQYCQKLRSGDKKQNRCNEKQF